MKNAVRIYSILLSCLFIYLFTLPSVVAQSGCITVNDVSFTSPSECGKADGSVTIDAVHEFGNPLQYSLDGGRIFVNSPTIGNLEAGVVYRLEIRDFLGLCFESYGSFELDQPDCNTDPCVANPFSINNFPDQNICTGGTVQLNVSGGVTYSWSPAVGLSATNIANPSANPTSTTTYTVTVTNSDGCIATDDITVNVSQNPIANAGSDTSICPGSSTSLSASGGTSYQWSPTNGLSNPSSANLIANPSTTTTYSVTVSNANGCSSSDQVVVSVVAGLTIDLGEDIITCPDERIALSVSGGSTYRWSPATGLSSTTIANPTATVSEAATYCVTVTDANGCTDADCIAIQIDTGCDFDEDGDAAGNGNVNEEDDEGAGSGSATDNGTVNEEEEDGFGSNAGNGSTINNCLNGPIVLACQDKIICPTGETQLVVNGGIRWEWTPATGLDNPFSAIPIASPSVTTVYTVTGWDENDCFATEEVVVTVDPNRSCEGATPPPCIEGLIPEERMCIGPSDNLVDICLPFPEEDLTRYTISVDGTTPTVIHGCDFQPLIGYQYNLLPDQTDNYKIKSWQINDTFYSGMFNSINELIAWMQGIDPTGNWRMESSISSIIGGNTANVYHALIISQQSTTMEIGLLPNITQLPTGTLIQVDMTGKDSEILTVVEVTTSCTDELLIERCN